MRGWKFQPNGHDHVAALVLALFELALVPETQDDQNIPKMKGHSPEKQKISSTAVDMAVSKLYTVPPQRGALYHRTLTRITTENLGTLLINFLKNGLGFY